MTRLTITRPDDWHIHLRDGNYLPRTVADASRYFGRLLVMPNLVPPVTDVQAAKAYRDRILALAPAGLHPRMTLYLTDETRADSVIAAKRSGLVAAFKLYPAGATTNSAAGVTAINRLYPVFERMQEYDLVLSIHGEVTDAAVDVFDRESVFIDRVLTGITRDFPALRIVLEHITTAEAVAFVESAPAGVAATITAHHLLYNRNDMLAGTMKPVYFCLPLLKRDRHQKALIDAATSGKPSFFLGTDSAPHPRHAKENACGCAAGCYTAHAAIELYAEVFASQGRLERLEGFASHFGADFYRMPRNQDKITLQPFAWRGPETLGFGDDRLMPLRGGAEIAWQVTQGTRHPLEQDRTPAT